jgi:hypothetical protein
MRVSVGQLSSFSPDFSRALHFDLYSDAPYHVYDVENDVLGIGFAQLIRPFEWIPDSSGFVAGVPLEVEMRNSTVANLILFDRDGNQLDVIFPMSYFRDYTFSADGHNLAFIADDHLYIADMTNRIVNNMCFEITPFAFFRQMAWSPDSTYLAFTHDGYPILLNTETLEMQVLDYQTGQIIGWYPLP